MSIRVFVVVFMMLVSGSSLAALAAATAPPEPPLPAVRAIQSGSAAPEHSSADSLVAPGDTETVEWTAELPRRLRNVAVGERLRALDFPVSPGRRFTIDFERVDVYAPDAEIRVVDGPRSRVVPRSDWRFFAGRSPDRDVRVLLVENPATGALRATTAADGETWSIEPSPRGGRLAELMPLKSRERLRAGGETSQSCGQGDERLDASVGFSFRASETAPPERAAAEALTSLHTATIAVDTDNELMNLKFGNNTTTATNYIANLIAAMSVFYERDVNLRLLQGLTFLRVSTTADPYNGGTGSADGTKLSEFSNYWGGGCAGSCTGAARALAMMLSGKQSSNNSASGIAWLDGGCSNSIGYSFTQVFKFAPDTSSNDAFIVGHELGHNFGSPHTHCYSPVIDTCRSGEGGCYSGATSCPAPQTINGVPNVRGTIMSYCHLLGGCAAANVFHPRTLTEQINPHVESKVGICIFSGFQLTSLAPVSAPTAGGTPVLLVGSAMTGVNSVTFGGTPATILGVTATTVSVLAPAHAAGVVNVVVSKPGSSVTRANGFFYGNPSAASRFYTVTPCRLVDTRGGALIGGPALAASAQRSWDLTQCGIPDNAAAVSANVTITGPTAGGHLTFYPGDAIPLGTSTISFSAGATRANSATLRLATNGTRTVGVQNVSGGTVHVIVDVNGYYQ